MTTETLPETAARTFRPININLLKVDHRYQRVPDPRRITRMVRNFDIRLVGALVCSVRDDGIYVIDGQHRLEVLRSKGETEVWCELHQGLTPADEAQLFYHLDSDRATLNSGDAFRALLSAEDSAALAVKDMIEKAGLHPTFRGNDTNGVRSFKTIMGLVRVQGAAIVADALQIMADAWRGQRNIAAATVLQGMVMFLQTYPDIDRRELSHSLAEHSNPSRLTQLARDIAGSLSWGSKLAAARAILGTYNYHRSTNRLEPRFEAMISEKRSRAGKQSHVRKSASE